MGNAMPKKTFWSKQERDQIEELRQDPDEALEKMTKHMRELAQNWKKEKTAIEERVHAIPAMSFRSKDERDRIEELRQDPEEAREKMINHMRELGRSYKEQKTEMTKKVSAKAAISVRTKEEIDQIEELRQDSNEARQKMERHMQER